MVWTVNEESYGVLTFEDMRDEYSYTVADAGYVFHIERAGKNNNNVRIHNKLKREPSRQDGCLAGTEVFVANGVSNMQVTSLVQFTNRTCDRLNKEEAKTAFEAYSIVRKELAKLGID